jgi:hypothetical protein
MTKLSCQMGIAGSRLRDVSRSRKTKPANDLPLPFVTLRSSVQISRSRRPGRYPGWDEVSRSCVPAVDIRDPFTLFGLLRTIRYVIGSMPASERSDQLSPDKFELQCFSSSSSSSSAVFPFGSV